MNILLEARDKNSEFNRLFKLYGKKFIEACGEYVTFRSYMSHYDDGGRTAVMTYLDSCLSRLGFDVSSGYPSCVEFIVRLFCDKRNHTSLFNNYPCGMIGDNLRKFEKFKSSGLLSNMGLSGNLLDYDLYSFLNAVESVEKDVSHSALGKKMDKMGDAIKKVFDNGQVGIFAVSNWRANRLLGDSTSWCTVGNISHNIRYGGVYYIICYLGRNGVPLLDDQRVQYHYENRDGKLYACDTEDNTVELDFIAERFGEDVADFILDSANVDTYMDSLGTREKGNDVISRNKGEMMNFLDSSISCVFDVENPSEKLFGYLGAFVGEDFSIVDIDCNIKTGPFDEKYTFKVETACGVILFLTVSDRNNLVRFSVEGERSEFDFNVMDYNHNGRSLAASALQIAQSLYLIEFDDKSLFERNLSIVLGENGLTLEDFGWEEFKYNMLNVVGVSEDILLNSRGCWFSCQKDGLITCSICLCDDMMFHDLFRFCKNGDIENVIDKYKDVWLYSFDKFFDYVRKSKFVVKWLENNGNKVYGSSRFSGGVHFSIGDDMFVVFNFRDSSCSFKGNDLSVTISMDIPCEEILSKLMQIKQFHNI